mgnify:CR=1 FL=1
MNVYIPIMGILQFLAVYAIVGALLFVPLVYWQARFISGNRGAWEGVRTVQGFFQSLIAWPTMLGYTIFTEIKYRRKGIL